MQQQFDTAGQDKFNSLVSSYFKQAYSFQINYRGAQGFVIVFDYSRKTTYENIGKWIQQIRAQASVDSPTIMVVGNKRDLEQKEVSNKELEDFQTKHLNVLYLETSARTGFQIEEAFKRLTIKMLEKGQQVEIQGFKLPNKSVRISKELNQMMPQDSICCQKQRNSCCK